MRKSALSCASSDSILYYNITFHTSDVQSDFFDDVGLGPVITYGGRRGIRLGTRGAWLAPMMMAAPELELALGAAAAAPAALLLELDERLGGLLRARVVGAAALLELAPVGALPVVRVLLDDFESPNAAEAVSARRPNAAPAVSARRPPPPPPPPPPTRTGFEPAPLSGHG